MHNEISLYFCLKEKNSRFLAMWFVHLSVVLKHSHVPGRDIGFDENSESILQVDGFSPFKEIKEVLYKDGHLSHSFCSSFFYTTVVLHSSKAS